MTVRRYAKPTKFEIIQCLLLVLAIIIALFVLFILRGYHQINSIYEGIAEDVIETDEEGFPIDVDKLLKINKNFVGWIQFPSDGSLSQINYPIVHATSEEEDQYYLNHTFDKKRSFAGCIFTASWEKGDFSDVTDDNTIIYGHAMNNKTMFGGIKELRDQSFYNSNQTFYIFTREKRIYQYHIIAAFETQDGSDAYTYRFADEASYDKHIDYVMSKSDIKAEVGEEYEPRHMVTLSTCNNRSDKGRVVIVGVKKRVLSYTKFKG